MLLLLSLLSTIRIRLDLLSIIVRLDNIVRMVCLGLSSESCFSFSFSFCLTLYPYPSSLYALSFCPLVLILCYFKSIVNPWNELMSSPPSSSVSNALTDKATSKPPRPDTTAGSGSTVTPGVDGWITSWGLTVCPLILPESKS